MGIKLSRAAFHSETLFKNSFQPKNSLLTRGNCTAGYTSSLLPVALPKEQVAGPQALHTVSLLTCSHQHRELVSVLQSLASAISRGEILSPKERGNQQRHLLTFRFRPTCPFCHTPSSCLNSLLGLSEGAI